MTPSCTCSPTLVPSDVHKPHCAAYGMLQWRVYARWCGYRTEHATVWAPTSFTAIHAARRDLDLEPAHAIAYTGKSLNRMRNLRRFHHNVDGETVVVEETAT